ncbi:MAG: hypothetical protein J5796_05485 [Erysipelotrichaceae bacterium]|nr:hypothetical protein [Erysipelotrichaceae bacterium]
MKKLLILFILLCLFGCTGKQEPTIEPEPVPEPTPEPEPPVIHENKLVLPEGWIVHEFDLEGDVESFVLKEGVTLTFSGKEMEEPYCQDDKCLVYDTVTVNGKHLSYYEDMQVKVNVDYGRLYMYNLNDQLYLLAFDPIAQYTIYNCVVFDDEGNVVKELPEIGLTMNTEYQNMFLASKYDETGTEISAKIYTAVDKTLEEKDF